MASSEGSAISAACAVASAECETIFFAVPSATRLARQADVVYSEATEILSSTPSASRKVLGTDCVTATFWSGTPKHL